MSRLPSDPSRLPGTIVARDRTGRRIPLREIEGMVTVREAAAATGIDGLTLRLWAKAFGVGVGARFEPDGLLFLHLHVVATIALLRDARGALPPHSCEPGSPRHHVVRLAILAALKAKDVPSDAVINDCRRRLGLPPRPKRDPPALHHPVLAEVRDAG